MVLKGSRIGHSLSVFVLQIQDFDSENKAPSEWEVEIHPDQLAHSKAKILSLLNSGSVKDLRGLHLIGKKKAELIVSWRENYGFFSEGWWSQRAEFI